MPVKIAIVLILAAASATSADLYAIGGFGGTQFVYRVSTTDASMEVVAPLEPNSGFGDMTLAPDGVVYAVGVEGIYALTPSTGDIEFVVDVPPNCLFAGSLTPDASGTLHAGAALFCDAMLGWNVFCACDAGAIRLPGTFFAWTAQVRGDSSMLLMEFEDPTVHVLDMSTGELSVGGVLEGVPNVMGFERDGDDFYVVTGLLGQDQTLHAFDPFTFELTLIGTLTPGVDVFGIAAMPCEADFNTDGQLNVLDFVAFQLAWQAGDERADVNADGVLDTLDFVAFQELFQAGC